MLIGALLLFCLPSGCKKQQPAAPPPPPAQAKVAASPKSAVQKQQSSAVNAVKTESQLDFSTKKDPFKPFITEAPPVAAKQQGPAAPLVKTGKLGDILPIQAYDVTKFKVSGIITGAKENRALIIDPAGKGYVVRQGMRIGNNDGHISRISASAIEVVEQFKDENGRQKKKTIKLTMPQKK